VSKADVSVSNFDLGDIAAIVFDVFTNWKKGSDLEGKDLPELTMLTTWENFDQAVGPIFAQSKSLFVNRAPGPGNDPE